MYHVRHITRFVEAQKIAPEMAEGMTQRAQKAASKFGFEGHFASTALEEVLGSEELANTFRELWNSHMFDIS